MQCTYDELFNDVRITFDEQLFMRYLGVIFKMSLYNLANVDRYWEKSPWDGVDFQIGQFMSRNTFRRFTRLLQIPGPNNATSIFNNVLVFMEECTKHWQ